jgi:hypothetical protein
MQCSVFIYNSRRVTTFPACAYSVGNGISREAVTDFQWRCEFGDKFINLPIHPMIVAMLIAIMIATAPSAPSAPSAALMT